MAMVGIGEAMVAADTVVITEVTVDMVMDTANAQL